MMPPTHIDPFAPADSPQHPANFQVAPRGQEQTTPAVVVEDIAPSWIALPDEPVSPKVAGTAEGDKILDARWEEYEELLRAHGPDEQVAYLEEVTATWPDDMPTLLQLRQLREEAATSPPEEPEQPAADEDPEAELQAALEKLGRK